MTQKVSLGKGMWLLASFVLLGLTVGRETEWLVVLPAALLHETGHYLAARLCGVRVSGLRLGLLGARMELDGLLSYGREFWIALGGPLVNAVCALGVWGMVRCGLLHATKAWTLFAYASVGLGGLNLLPVGTMDGGRMLAALISRWISPRAAEACLQATTVLCLGGLWLLSAYALLRGAPMMSAFVFCIILLLRYASPDGRQREV